MCHTHTHLQSTESVILQPVDVVPCQVEDAQVLKTTKGIGRDQVEAVAIECKL